MKITVEFESTREATAFMEKFIVDEKRKKNQGEKGMVDGNEATKMCNPVKIPEAYAAPVAPVVAPLAPVAPVAPVVAPVAPVLTALIIQDIINASVSVVEQGKRAELITLLSTFGVASVSELPTARYEEFIIAVKNIGA